MREIEYCRIIISRINITSQLSLGDLSRHHQKPFDNASDDIKTIYKQYQKKHKQLADSKLKTVCVSNLTQGIIEQYFSELKRVYLKDGRAVRLDDLVEKLYEQFLVTEKLYCDFIIHKGYRRKRKARKVENKVENNEENKEMSHKVVTNLS